MATAKTDERRLCAHCTAPFVIEAEDFDFYRKMGVPPPTWCPECRLARRLSFLNVSNLFRRPCDLCGKETISLYHKDLPYRVYCETCWWSDRWDPLDYGRDYDFSRPFFAQLDALWREVPLLGLSVDTTNVNSPYTNLSGHVKDSYLLFHADFDEDCNYGFYVMHSKNLLDSSLMIECDYCYDSMHGYQCNGCVGLRSQVTESVDCAFLKDCANCQDCFGSANLRNKRYYIFNKPYRREEYIKERATWDLGSYSHYQEAVRRAADAWKTVPPRPFFMDFSVESTGNNIFESRRCRDSFEVIGAEDSRYLMMMYIGPVKDCYDCTSWGNNQSLCYEACNVGEGASRVRFSQECGLDNFDIEYSKLAYGGAAHQFGCVAMRGKKFSILNKVYPEGEYRALRQRIIDHMDTMPYVDPQGAAYRYGEFFPPQLSPFPYHATLAQDFFPLTEESARAQGLRWLKEESSSRAVSRAAADLPDHINDAEESILQEVIDCASCGKGYRIIGEELRFLKDWRLPLPRTCPFCRIHEKIRSWASRRVTYPRTCARCGKSFMSCYSEAQVPVILCMEDWNAEVA